MSTLQIQVNGGWVDLDTALANGLDPVNHNYALRQKENFMSEEATVSAEALSGTMVVYHGEVYEDSRGNWAMIQEVREGYAHEPDNYDLAIIGFNYRDYAAVTEVLPNVPREDFTVVPMPALPEPPMKDGYYVSKESGKAYSRKAGVWYYYDTGEAFPWQKLGGWRDAQVRGTLTYLAPEV